MKFCLLIFFLAAVARATDVDWSQVKPMDIDPPQLKCPLERVSGEPRVVGGKEAKPGQFPYQVALITTLGLNEFFCGGSILSKEWILTAAHCVENIDKARVIFGAHNVTKKEAGQVRIEAAQFIVHENWNDDTKANDIAVVRLQQGIKFSPLIRPTRLPARSQVSKSFDGLSGTISGWGRTSDASMASSPVLRYASNPIINNAACEKWYRPDTIINSHVCLNSTSARSTCHGDSGGPLVVTEKDGKRTQIGITSFGISSGCESGYPSVYTRITSYLDWIAKKTGVPIRT